MSLFDRASGSQSRVKNALSPAEAFTAIVLIAVASDGNLSQTQAQEIYQALSHLKLLKSYSQDEMLSMFDILLGIIRHEGVNDLFDSAKDSLSEDLREAAFAVATDLILTDGILVEEEDFLKELYQALRIQGEVGQKIIEVMLIKNRG
ncbi:tellurite resistance TerB family protein [Rivularia sp. UHCC 0363]|uniref:tellurite resistance TerB family protein n=1 Tax=Rivularia sp. UHCC 0363 TaxID=3110244 RepID=UPI002B1FE0E8|nr:tellurite resistance TerB family protein [Rivularia sp. UHCC 0363]MEA5592907.1 tellurite resistance TerB family protein [Rivularia sp. UHCC 0363]